MNTFLIHTNISPALRHTFPIHLLARNGDVLTQDFLWVDQILLLHSGQEVHSESRLRRPDKGTTFRVTGRDTKSQTQQSSGSTVSFKFEVLWCSRLSLCLTESNEDYLHVKYWTPLWLPSCLPLSGLSHSTPSHSPTAKNVKIKTIRITILKGFLITFTVWFLI